jgi:hypothetical protein
MNEADAAGALETVPDPRVVSMVQVSMLSRILAPLSHRGRRALETLRASGPNRRSIMLETGRARGGFTPGNIDSLHEPV